jgi:Short C-terminal domain
MSSLIVIFTFVLVFLVCLLVIWWWIRKVDDGSTSRLNPSLFKGSFPTALLNALGAAEVRTGIIFNGKEYPSVEEMPEEVRRTYEQAISGVLADSDRNGIPDLFERGGASVFQTEVMTRKLEDPAEKLKQLKDMRDSSLITEQEYETKKAEILARM